MVKHICNLLALLLIAGAALAGEGKRDRKARVALALAAAERTPPAPHAIALPGYAEAYALAVKKAEPLVVYVGCDGSHPIEQLPDAVVAVATELPGYDRGAVVVGYPRDGRLFVHAALRCPEHGEALAKVVDEARKKIAAPPAKPLAAPVPLNWTVLAGPLCVCGSGCACASGVCPQRCPVVK